MERLFAVKLCGGSVSLFQKRIVPWIFLCTSEGWPQTVLSMIHCCCWINCIVLILSLQRVQADIFRNCHTFICWWFSYACTLQYCFIDITFNPWCLYRGLHHFRFLSNSFFFDIIYSFFEFTTTLQNCSSAFVWKTLTLHIWVVVIKPSCSAYIFSSFCSFGNLSLMNIMKPFLRFFLGQPRVTSINFLFFSEIHKLHDNRWRFSANSRRTQIRTGFKIGFIRLPVQI